MEKITDFGAKIGGARKDMAAEYVARFALITNEALASQPLSKVYKLPNLRAMYQGGEITDVQAVMCLYAWQQVKTKPHSRGLQRWVTETRNVLQVITDILSGNCATFDGAFSASNWSLFVAEMQAANWPASEYNKGPYSIVTGYTKNYCVCKGRQVKGHYDTIFESVKAIQVLTSASYVDSQKSPKFEVRQWRSSGEFLVCPVGKRGICLRREIYSIEEVRRICREEVDELTAEYTRLRTFPDERREWNRPRRGVDYRAGADLHPDTFSGLIPFRGVEFGNWVTQVERSSCLNECADALCDLAKIIGVGVAMLTQNSTLSMAFGARGSGGALAHYESCKRVINLTKKKGAGSLAHEWWHSLDNYLMIEQGQSMMFAVDNYHHITDERLKQAASALRAAINNSDFARRSIRIDTFKSKSYWGTMIEMSARAFETYVYYKMEAAGMSNDYLVNFKLPEEYGREEYPYPTREEVVVLAPLYSELLAASFGLDELASVEYYHAPVDNEPMDTQKNHCSEVEVAEPIATIAASQPTVIAEILLSDKEKNTAICLELQAIAASFVAEHAENLLKVSPDKSVYTTVELRDLIAKNPTVLGLNRVTREHVYLNPVKMKESKKKNYLIDSVESLSSDYKQDYVDCRVTSFNAGRTASVSVGSFHCEFDVAKVFDYTQKFEKLAHVKTKSYVLPAKEEKVLLSFTVTFDKELAQLAKCVAKDNLRPIMERIFLSVERSELVASDGYVLTVFPASISNVSGDASCQVLINPKDAASLKGECYVQVTEGECGGTNTAITNAAGERFNVSASRNFPKYWIVYPKGVEKGHTFKVVDIKAFLSFVKKVCNDNRYLHRFTMESAGLEAIKLTYTNLDFDVSFSTTIPVCGLLHYSFRLGIDAKRILKLANSFNGEITVSDPESPVLFGSDKTVISFCMPSSLYENELYMGYITKNVFPEVGEVEPIAPVQEETEAEAEAETDVLVSHRKYFAKAEATCTELDIREFTAGGSHDVNYSLVPFRESGIRMYIRLANGLEVWLDYDTRSRHRDAYLYSVIDGGKTRIKNWTVAMELLREKRREGQAVLPVEAPGQEPFPFPHLVRVLAWLPPAGTPPYGACELSLLHGVRCAVVTGIFRPLVLSRNVWQRRTSIRSQVNVRGPTRVAPMDLLRNHCF